MTHIISAALMFTVYTQNFWVRLTLAMGHSGIISKLTPIPPTLRYESNNRDVVDV